ncbi:MAG: hypothetical protein GX573_22100 [Chloroflexi bacterium]|nr:hypothetical protein [Chloroflexota bacterium]
MMTRSHHPHSNRPALPRAGLLALGLLLFAAMMAACGAAAEPAVVTIAPSATSTHTPAPSPTATSATETAARPTERPTVPTATPGITATPGPNPTSPLAPTSTLAPQTPTATGEVRLRDAAIQYFTTDSEIVRPGENVTLFWSVRGTNRARIFRLDEDDERLFRWDVAGEGRLTVGTRPQDRDAARFLLEADVSGTTVEQALFIPLGCADFPWFFDPAPASCPAAPAEVSSQVEQTFERGRMIWVQTQDRIYVIFEDGLAPGWALYPDEFNEGDPERDESLVPPPDLSQPIRGFGLVWRTNERVRSRLGWAISAEVPYEGMVQSDSPEPGLGRLYLRMRDGGILALDSQADDWEVLAAPAPTTDTLPQ